MNIVIFTGMNNRCMLHGRVFVMVVTHFEKGGKFSMEVILLPSFAKLASYYINVFFLAHLSRRLIGELIVYKGIRCPSVRPFVRPSVCQHFQTTSPLKP